MQLNERLQRRLAWTALGAVWLYAGAVGVQIGLDIGHAIFG